VEKDLNTNDRTAVKIIPRWLAYFALKEKRKERGGEHTKTTGIQREELLSTEKATGVKT